MTQLSEDDMKHDQFGVRRSTALLLPASHSLDDHGYELLRSDTCISSESVLDGGVVGRPDGGNAQGQAIGRLKRQHNKPDCTAKGSVQSLQVSLLFLETH